MQFGGYKKFSFFIQFWWDFFHCIPLSESFQNCYSHFFSISYHFQDTRGPIGQKRNFQGYIKFSFFIQFWLDFFHWIDPLKERSQNCYSRFFLSLTVFQIQGTQKAKNAIFKGTLDFHFHLILIYNLYFLGEM